MESKEQSKRESILKEILELRERQLHQEEIRQDNRLRAICILILVLLFLSLFIV